MKAADGICSCLAVETAFQRAIIEERFEIVALIAEGHGTCYVDIAVHRDKRWKITNIDGSK